MIYLKTQDETKLFTFYKDTNFFLLRKMTSVSDVTANFNSPTQVPLSASGVQTACFNEDYSAIFILGVNSDLFLYNVLHETLQTIANPAYYNME